MTDFAWSALSASGLSYASRVALLVVFGLLLVVLGFLFAYAIRMRRPLAPPNAPHLRPSPDTASRSTDQPSARWSSGPARPPAPSLLQGFGAATGGGAAGVSGWGEAGAMVHASPRSSRASLEPLVCPTCRQRYELGLEHCPRDARRLVPAVEFEGDAGGCVCPTCRRGFDRGTRVCPFDGAELCPLVVYQASHQGALIGASSGPAGVMAKICPKCRRRHDLAAVFCGRDGAELVAIH